MGINGFYRKGCSKCKLFILGRALSVNFDLIAFFFQIGLRMFFFGLDFKLLVSYITCY